MNVAPLVSICIPVYNTEKYISQTLQCLVNQTYKNIEIILVDDGSSDRTHELIKAVNDPRIIFTTQDHKGASAARNLAYKLSSGDLIKFLDADDPVNDQFIELQVEKLNGRTDCVASCSWGRFRKDDMSDFKLAPEKVWQDLPSVDWVVNSLIDNGYNMMGSHLFLIPRNIVEKAGLWDESLDLLDDFEYMTRIILKSEYVLFAAGAILMYRSGIANSLSALRSLKHLRSALAAVDMSSAMILEKRNDKRSRLACANTYQNWNFQLYPYYPELSNYAEKRIKELGGADIRFGGGKIFQLLISLLGWKRAKKIKLLLNKYISLK